MKPVQSAWGATHIYYFRPSSQMSNEVLRAWYNGVIVWVPQDSDIKYLRISPNELYLRKINNYSDTFNISSNTTWEIY